MKSKSIKAIIYSQLGSSNDLDEASWKYQEGVVISENHARSVLKMIDALMKVVEAKSLIIPVTAKPEHFGEVEALSKIVNECKQSLKESGVQL